MSTAAEALVQVYGQATVARIAQTLGAGPEPEALGTILGDKTRRRRLVEELPVPSREILAFVDSIGRRLRGERLKKRWFLHGYAEFDERIMPLVDRGIVLVGNLGAREPVSLETALEQGLLQQWIQVTPGFEGLAGEPPEAREVVEHLEDETTLEVTVRSSVFEYNVLSAARFTEGQKIRLNRDGSPHRSDLKALAPLIIDRIGGGSEHLIDPNSVDGWDLLVFLLSVAEAIGCVERRDDVLRARSAGFEYFRKSLPERLTLLMRAIEGQRAWSEVHAAVWKATSEPPITGQGDGGFLEEGGPGAGLGGARGSVLSALRRLSPSDWFNLEETVQTISNLELQYLATVLPSGSDEVGVATFVRAVIEQTLVHIGAVDLGRGSDGTARARVTPIGRALLGITDAPPPEPDGKGGLMVEPSHEITCFLDLAPLRLLFDLARFAEIAHTSERVVRYRLVGESVQWGYSRGYTADAILQILENASARPIPSAVVFSLQDWERLHRRVTVLLSGDIIAATGKSDPELVQSGVQFAIDGDDAVEIIDFVHTFVIDGHRDALDRALNAYKPRVIDYTGPIIPSLLWLDEQRIKAPAGSTDLRLLARLGKFCEAEDDEIFRVSPPRIRTNFPDGDGYQSLINLLREGVLGGLAAEKELTLKQLLGEPARVRVQPMEVLVVASADDGDRIARVQSAREFIAERLGPRTFHVIPGCTNRLLQHLTQFGIVVD